MSCFSGQIVEKENSERRRRGKTGTPSSGVVSSRRSPPERYLRESFSCLFIRPAQYGHHRTHCARYQILHNSSNGCLHIGLRQSRSNWCSIGDLPLLRGLTFDILYLWVVGTAKMTSTEYNSDGPTLNWSMGSAEGTVSNDTKTLVFIITFVISRTLMA